jgi:hypothetical protein
MSDGLGLHGGVDADPLQTGGPHGAALQPGLMVAASSFSSPSGPSRLRQRVSELGLHGSSCSKYSRPQNRCQ